MKAAIRGIALFTMFSALFTGATWAAELADVCWTTDRGTPLRFSITQSGTNHYTYTGIFDDGDGVSFAILGEVAVSGAAIVGSFSGSKSTASVFKTGIWRLTLDSNLAGTVEGIRSAYDRSSAGISTDYRTSVLTPVACP